MSRTPRKLYRELIATTKAIRNCEQTGNTEWRDRHSDNLAKLETYMPNGSGIDSGCEIAHCDDSKIVIAFSYHHMNDNGYYDGWTEHKLTIRPSFDGIDMSISGRDRNNIKDYLYDTFHHCLNAEVWQDENGQWHNSNGESK